MPDTKPCRDCGREFKRSRADRTVRCPACRKGTPPPPRAYACVVCCDERYITSQYADGRVSRDPCYRCNH